MQSLRHLPFPIALCSLAVLARGQVVDANAGPFAGTSGLLAVDQQTGLAAGRLLTKGPGYFVTNPIERPPIPGAPDFRAQSMLQGLQTVLQIDAFSIGMDWIVSNDSGECTGPEGRWAVLLFSVTRGTVGTGGGPVDRESNGSVDGAAGDLFCYEFQRDTIASQNLDNVTKALDSTDILIHPTAGTSNMTAYDYFASLYTQPDLLEKPPKAPMAYFSVTGGIGGTAASLPIGWCGGNALNRSGATVFKTTWRPGLNSWSTPSVYIAWGDLGLGQGDDVDALAVDTSHHANEYVLFSTTNPGIDRIRFHNRGTGYVGTYRYAGGGQTIESRLGILTGDVDALCAADPGADEPLTQLAAGIESIAPGIWPPTGSSQPGPVDLTMYRDAGSTLLHGYASSNNLNSTHWWYVVRPDAPGGPVLIPPTQFTQRQAGWNGSPSHFTWQMNPPALRERLQFGVVEVPQVGSPIHSRLVEITEWAERSSVTAPAMFASTEGSGISTGIWRAGTNRVQCIYDTTNFTGQGVGVNTPMLIDELEWRLAGGLPGALITYPSVNIYLQYAQTDYLSQQTTFAANRTIPFPTTPNFSGPVGVRKAWSLTPNKFSIRAKLQTPFLYDPTLGQDLLVEFEIMQQPNPLTASSMSTSSNAALHAANSVRSTSTLATFGTASAFCPVCRFGYSVPAAAAITKPYGQGCYDRRQSFYQTFQGGGFDLGGWPVHSFLLTPANSGYTVSPGSNTWYTPVSAGLNLTDDSVAYVSLPQSFVSPAGATNQLTICSNGFVTLNGSSTNTSYVPTAAALLAGEPRFCLLWADILPNSTFNVKAESGPGNMYYVTWANVPTYPTYGTSGVVTIQLAMNLNTGTVEFRYQGCTVPSPSLVGWSPGVSSLDPGGCNLHDLPFATSPDRASPQLSASPRAVTGYTVTYTVSRIDPTAYFSLLMMNVGGVDPGVELSILGMPSCWLYVNFPPAVMHVLLGIPTATFQLTIPNSPSLAGIGIDNQAAVWVPGLNPFGAVTSNGLVTIVGTL